MCMDCSNEILKVMRCSLESKGVEFDDQEIVLEYFLSTKTEKRQYFYEAMKSCGIQYLAAATGEQIWILANRLRGEQCKTD
jgi:hypothetical protein